jgi:tetratricopeptide (TPR) repeat protein
MEPNTGDQEAWAELLGTIKYDEESPAAKNERARHGAGKSGLSGGQRAILIALALVAIGFLALVVMALTGSLPTTFAGLTLQQAATPTAPPLEEMDPEAPAVEQMTPATPTEAPTPELERATEAAPTVTPVPTGPLTTAYDEQLRKDPTNVELYLQRGREFLRIGAYEAALQDFSLALQLDNQRAEAYEGLGWAAYYLFRWEAAREAFDSAIALSSRDSQIALPGAHFGLGLMHTYQGSYRNASREFDRAAEIDPLNAEYEAWLAMAAARLGDTTEARDAATRAIDLTQDLSLVYVARSWARRIDVPSDIDGAQGDLLYARNLAPNDFLTLNAIAEFYLENRPERLGEAEQLATFALNWATNDVEKAVALHTLGRIYLQQGRQADALDVLEAAVSLTSREGEILLAGLEEALATARGSP